MWIINYFGIFRIIFTSLEEYNLKSVRIIVIRVQ